MRPLPKYHAIVCALVAMTTGAGPLSADLVVDDFDDSVEVVSPQMVDDFVSTPHVGDLNATRSIRVVAFQGNPDGRLDANVSVPSTLTGQISRLNPVPGGETLVAVQSNYEFTPTDIAQGGANNAFFFDFTLLTSELPPSLFMILVRDDAAWYDFKHRSLARRESPFTVIVPFDAFNLRGGGPATPHYDVLEAINVELRASMLAGGGPDLLNFNVQLDRIRIGQVPEPAALPLILLALGLALTRPQLRVRKVLMQKGDLSPCLANFSGLPLSRSLRSTLRQLLRSTSRPRKAAVQRRSNWRRRSSTAPA
jgi:hypothetical protein